MTPPKLVAVGKDNPLAIGHIAMLSMPEDLVKANKVIRAWAHAGLDPDDLPDVRTPADVFASACRSVASARSKDNPVEVKVDQVKEDATEIVYQVTRMVRDREHRLIEHPKAMTLTLNKVDESISCVQLEDYDKLADLELAIREHYQKHAKDLSGQKIRNAITEIVLRLGAQNVKKRAGVYFIPNEYHGDAGQMHDSRPVLDSINTFFEDLYGDRASLWLLPVMDDDAQKQQIAKHFAINVNERLEAAMLRAIERKRQGKGRGVRSDLMANLWNEARACKNLVKQYDELVGIERGTIDANLRDLDDALMGLQDMADGNEAAA